LGTLVVGWWGAKLYEGLGRDPSDIVVTKKRPSAFFATDLDIVLRGLGITEVVVCGVSTNWAVESTVRDAHSHDYEVVVVADATGTAAADLHAPSLRSMAAVFARLATTAELVSSGSPTDP
jgi:nicotinamidase-related amidase